MKKILSNKKFLIVLAILAVATMIYSFLPKKITTPTLLSSTPIDKSTKASVFDPLKFVYDQQILLNKITVTSVPEENWNIEQDSPTSIILTHKRFLMTNQSYVVNVYYNNKLANTLSFTTKAEQNDPRYLQTVQATMDRDFPLSLKLPYSTDSYRVVYSAPMTLEVSIKNPNILPEKAISDIKSWVTSVGGDASAHKYIIGDKPLPSLAPTGIPENRNTGKPSPTPFNWDTLQDDGT